MITKRFHQIFKKIETNDIKVDVQSLIRIEVSQSDKWDIKQLVSQMHVDYTIVNGDVESTKDILTVIIGLKEEITNEVMNKLYNQFMISTSINEVHYHEIKYWLLS